VDVRIRHHPAHRRHLQPQPPSSTAIDLFEMDRPSSEMVPRGASPTRASNRRCARWPHRRV